MGKSVKKKSYTEDVVLNKILKDIAEENLQENTPNHTTHQNQKNTYEDDLIRQYREKDALEQRKKYFNAVKITAIVALLILLVVTFINYVDSIIEEETPRKNITTSASFSEPKAEETFEPIQINPTKTEPTQSIRVKEEIELQIKQPTPPKEPVKRTKTEREIAKEMLLQQMQN